MSVEWRRLSREVGLKVHAGRIYVSFADGRRQAVFVDDSNGCGIRIWSEVASPEIVSGLNEPLLEAWRRNRLSELVGFSIDGGGRMIGEAWVPDERLTAEEWEFYVREMARACDRLEYVLTGGDEA